MRAATLIMNDDVDGAERGLSQANSSYHKLGMGVILFLRATLGFEQEIIKAASDQLAEAETSASNDLYRAQRSDKYNANSLYAPGSEFALCNALSQIMGAVVSVLNESLTDAIRAFYKLRRAYMTLNGLVDEEDKLIKARGYSSGLADTRGNYLAYPSEQAGAKANAANQNSASNLASAQKRDDDEFYDANDAQGEKVTNTYTGHLVRDLPSIDTKMSQMSFADQEHVQSIDELPSSAGDPAKDRRRFSHGPESELFSRPIDVFVHSGVNLCFGLLLLLISAIPPAFGKLLYIIGFRGDRERGIKMLWQAARFNHVNGGLAGLALLGWYNGLVGFCDIVPDADPNDPEDVEGYPAARLEALLREMRYRYPSSMLWCVEEARMAATRRDLPTAIDVLSHNRKSSLKQVEAVTMFEKALAALYSHRHELCSDSFIACVDLNSWSRALYYYIAASAHLALYRECKAANKSSEAAQQASIAEKYFKLAPSHAGKKRIMARQLPFDIFVTRKINKWTARAAAWNCDFVDAIGVSPNEEMVFFWNGYKRMTAAQLEESLRNLAWSEDPKVNPCWEREGLDERAILTVLRASIYRNLRDHEKAKAMLKQEVLCHDKALFKGLYKDDWTAPTACYEMAVNLWMQRTEYIREYGAGIPDASTSPKQQDDAAPSSSLTAVTTTSPSSQVKIDIKADAKLVSECREWIEKTSKWESYDLDARIGLKVTTAADALRKWEARHGVASKR